jgi:hypothetical protein
MELRKFGWVFLLGGLGWNSANYNRNFNLLR